MLLLLALAAAAGCSRSEPAPKLTSPAIDEITAVQPGFRAPVPAPSGKYLAYIHAIGPGRRLYLYDLHAARTRMIPTTNEVTRIFGWSPDERYLAFAQQPPILVGTNNPADAEWLTVYDLENDSQQRADTNTDVIEEGATWLGPRSLFYSLRHLDPDYPEKFIFDPVAQSRRKVFNSLTDFVLAGSNTAVFFKDGNLQSGPVDSPHYQTATAVSHFPPGRFDEFRWLQYRPETGTFLFCARATNSQWRCLYEFNPAAQELKQLTTRGTYNGQRLGGGYAFVGNTNNEFYLALRPADPKLATNLFLGGSVVTYAAAADGGHIYAVASLKTEPPSLWIYNVNQRILRRLVPGLTRAWHAARLIEPRPKWTHSFDGLTIPYFIVPPADLLRNPHSTNRYPVALYLPPPTWQFQRSFDLPAQCYANLDYWFLAVNYRGGDGYGHAYSQQHDTEAAAKDALVALGKLGAAPNVDLQRVVLIGESGGTQVLLELMQSQPKQWRAAVLRHAPAGTLADAGLPATCPPLFLVVGDLEPSLNGIKDFRDIARTAGVHAELFVEYRTGHEVWGTDQIRDSMEAELDFVRRAMQ